MVREVLVAAAVTAALTPLVIRLLRRWSVLDHPNARSSHQQPTPRGGGLGPAVGALVALGLSAAVAGAPRAALALAAAGFGLLGLVEDLRGGLSPLVRFVFQLGLTAASLPFLLRGLDGVPAWQVLFAAGTFLWVVAYVNAFNFMDGINGISAMQAVVAGVAWWLLGELDHVPALAAGGAIVAGAGLAFAPYNFPSARVFLGDVGSYFLGAWLAVLVVVGLRADLAPEAVVLPISLYLVDTGMTLLRRFRRHETWHLPHRDHVYQRLVRRGWSHAEVTLGVGAVMAACSALGLVSRTAGLPLRAAADAVAALLLLAYLAAPALVDRSRHHVVAQRAGTNP